MNGWIKIHRKMLENPVVMKDAEHFAVWLYLLTHAEYEPRDVMYNGKRITLHEGQLVTSRREIARALKINQHKVDRIVSLFESEQQIEQQSEPHGNRSGRLISLLNWTSYQKGEPQNEPQSEPDVSHKMSHKVSHKVSHNENAQSQADRGIDGASGEEVSHKVSNEMSHKVSTYKEYKETKRSIFVRPTLSEVEAYCTERRNGIDPQRFIDYYESNGWKVGRSPMKDWKAAVRNWERREGTKPKSNFQNSAQGQNYDFTEIERLLVGRGQE